MTYVKFTRYYKVYSHREPILCTRSYQGNLCIFYYILVVKIPSRRVGSSSFFSPFQLLDCSVTYEVSYFSLANVYKGSFSASEVFSEFCLFLRRPLFRNLQKSLLILARIDFSLQVRFSYCEWCKNPNFLNDLQNCSTEIKSLVGNYIEFMLFKSKKLKHL